MYPIYRYPPRLVLAVARDLLLGRRRIFREDARAMAHSLGARLNVTGLEHLTGAGPCVVTFNHYARPGFGVWWLAAAIAAHLPAHAHVVMTAELTHLFPPLGVVLSRWALGRAARMYGFTSMPPMPPRPQDAPARAAAVRQVLRHVDAISNPVVLLAPEGGDAPDGRLAWPPQGVGRFLLLLAGKGLKVIPAGGREAAGALHVRFGAPFHLSVPPHLSPDEKDRAAAGAVMTRIAALLPEHLRGDFA